MGKYLSFELTGEARRIAADWFAAVDDMQKRRAQYLTGLGLGPKDTFMHWPDGTIRSVGFVQNPGKGWKPSKRHAGQWVPDSRTTKGKESLRTFRSFHRPALPKWFVEAAVAAGYETENFQPLADQKNPGACLIANIHLARLEEQLFLRVPHPEFRRDRNQPDPDPAKLPEGITEVPYSRFVAACERAGVSV